MSVTNPRLTCLIWTRYEAGLIPTPEHVSASDDLTGPEQMTMPDEVGGTLGRGTAGSNASSHHDHSYLRRARGARPVGDLPVAGSSLSTGSIFNTTASTLVHGVPHALKLWDATAEDLGKRDQRLITAGLHPRYLNMSEYGA